MKPSKYILLVEDEGDQAALIRETLQNANAAYEVRGVQSGEDAIAYLSGAGKYSDRNAYAFPFLVLLDLKMPGAGGFAVLRWLSGNPPLTGKLHVIVLSSAQSSKEIDVVYELGATYFLAKSESDRLVDLVERLECIAA